MGAYSGIRCFWARYVKNQALLIWAVELDVLKFLLQDRSKHLVIEWRLWSELAEKTFAYFCCGSSFEFPLCYDFCFAICMFWSVQWSPPSRALPRLEALSLQRRAPTVLWDYEGKSQHSSCHSRMPHCTGWQFMLLSIPFNISLLYIYTYI